MWGVSWLNLQMMMLDMVDVIYPEDAGRKAGRNEGVGRKMGWEEFMSAMHGIQRTL